MRDILRQTTAALRPVRRVSAAHGTISRWPVVASLTLLCLLAGLAVAGPAHAAAHWRTCKPGTKRIVGAYRVFDNAWRGPSATRFCVHSTGLNISIESNARPYGAEVVAYPSIRYGAFFTDRDPRSRLPVRVTRIGSLTLSVASRGHAAGLWLSDADMWFRPRADWNRHGTFELVIINRSAGFYPAAWPLARIRGLAYRWDEWTTCQRTGSAVRSALLRMNPAARAVMLRRERSAPMTALHPVLRSTTAAAIAAAGCDPAVRPWPILVFRQVKERLTARDRAGAFVWFARQHGFMHRSVWLGDVAYGSELWAQGRGLTDSMVIRGCGRRTRRRLGS